MDIPKTIQEEKIRWATLSDPHLPPLLEWALAHFNVDGERSALSDEQRSIQSSLL